MTSPQGQAEVAFAQAQLGKPYVWGATGPNSYDCSGLVYAALKAAGVPVGRVRASDFGRMGVAESLSSAQPGDVVYYNEPGATDHVGIYIGGGRMIDAPHSGATVEVDPIGSPTSIRRIVGGTVSNAPTDSTNPIANAASSAADAIGSAVGGIFGAWQTDLLGLGLKVAAATVAGALVIVGAYEALHDKGTNA